MCRVRFAFVTPTGELPPGSTAELSAHIKCLLTFHIPAHIGYPRNLIVTCKEHTRLLFLVVYKINTVGTGDESTSFRILILEFPPDLR